jgi:hypothetical protein
MTFTSESLNDRSNNHPEGQIHTLIGGLSAFPVVHLNLAHFVAANVGVDSHQVKSGYGVV